MYITDNELRAVMQSYLCSGDQVSLSSVCLYGLLSAKLVTKTDSLDTIFAIGAAVIAEMLDRGYILAVPNRCYKTTDEGYIFIGLGTSSRVVNTFQHVTSVWAGDSEPE